MVGESSRASIRRSGNGAAETMRRSTGVACGAGLLTGIGAGVVFRFHARNRLASFEAKLALERRAREADMEIVLERIEAHSERLAKLSSTCDLAVAMEKLVLHTSAAVEE